MMKLSIWHNIMWARYKAAVFSALYAQADASGIEVTFYQIAETESDRVALSPVDSSWHVYPYKLLFNGAYSSIPRLRLLRELSNRAWNDDVDLTILTGYERPEVWVQALILLIRRKKFAWFCDSTLYDNPQTFLRGLVKRLLFRIADGIFCYGQRSSEYALRYGARKENIYIRRQAAALPKDYSCDRALQQRIRLASPPQSPRYLYVGRLSPEKSVDRLLVAFIHVLKQHPNATLVIVGRGPAEQELRSLAERLGVSDRVDFAGSKFDEALVAEYLGATCLVLPSYSEPWGLVVNESLSYGCPTVVSNRCGCVPELATNGTTGLEYNWDSIDDLSEKLIRAPDAFKAVAETAKACIDRIAPFNPSASAAGIIQGSLQICSRQTAMDADRTSGAASRPRPQ